MNSQIDKTLGKQSIQDEFYMLDAPAYLYLCNKMFQKVQLSNPLNFSYHRCLICGIEFHFSYCLSIHLTTNDKTILLKLKNVNQEIIFGNHCSLHLYLKNYAAKNKVIDNMSLIEYINIKESNNDVIACDHDDFPKAHKKFCAKCLNLNLNDNNNDLKFDLFTINMLKDIVNGNIDNYATNSPLSSNTSMSLGLETNQGDPKHHHGFPYISEEFVEDNIVAENSQIYYKDNNNITSILEDNMCFECLMPLPSKEALLIHQNLHLQTKFACLGCHKYFLKAPDLNAHLIKGFILNPPKMTEPLMCWTSYCRRLLFECPFCAQDTPVKDKPFKKKYIANFSTLNIHIIKTHDSQNPGSIKNKDEFVCWYCLKTIEASFHQSTNCNNYINGENSKILPVNHILKCQSALSFRDVYYVCPFCYKTNRECISRGNTSNNKCLKDKSIRNKHRGNKFKTFFELVTHAKYFHQTFFANSSLDLPLFNKFPPYTSFKCKSCKLYFDDHQLLECHMYLKGHGNLNNSLIASSHRRNSIPSNNHDKVQFKSNMNTESHICAEIVSAEPILSPQFLSFSKGLTQKPRNIEGLSILDPLLPNKPITVTEMSKISITPPNNFNKKYSAETFALVTLDAESVVLDSLHLVKYSPKVDCSNLEVISSIQKSTTSLHESLKSSSNEILCKICSIKYYNQADLALHGTKHYPETPFICPLCDNLALISNTDLDNHITDVHSGKLKCVHCNNIYESVFTYITHLQEVYEVQNLICPFCGQSYNCFKNFKRHVHYFHGQKRWSCYKCWICKERCYKDIGKIIDHLNLEHKINLKFIDMAKISAENVTSFTSGLDGGPANIATILSEYIKANESDSNLTVDSLKTSMPDFNNEEDSLFDEEILTPNLKNTEQINTEAHVVSQAQEINATETATKRLKLDPNVESPQNQMAISVNPDVEPINLENRYNCNNLLQKLSENFIICSEGNLNVSSSSLFPGKNILTPTSITTTTILTTSTSPSILPCSTPRNCIQSDKPNICQNDSTLQSFLDSLDSILPSEPIVSRVNTDVKISYFEHTKTSVATADNIFDFFNPKPPETMISQNLDIATTVCVTNSNILNPITNSAISQPIPKKFNCQVCSMNFDEQTSLIKHGRIHGIGLLTDYSSGKSRIFLSTSSTTNTKQIISPKSSSTAIK